MRQEGGTYTRESLLRTLEEHGVSITGWGSGMTKTVDHLLKELNEGESELVRESRRLLHRYRVACVHVFGIHNRKKFVLREDRQVFADGRIRRREFANAVSEKIVGDEDPAHAALRGLKEELNVTGVKVEHLHDTVNTEPAMSYPGLTTERELYWYSATIRGQKFKPEGYIEKQKDKTTYFVWKRAHLH